jgi:hypothetical protein
VAVQLFTERRGIEYWEDFTGYSERHSIDGTEYRRRLKVGWNDAYNFVIDVLGETSMTPDPSDGSLVRYPPEPHPFFTSAYAVSMDFNKFLGVPTQYPDGSMAVEVRGGDGEMPEDAEGSGFAVYDVVYKVPTYTILEDDDIETELDRWVTRDGKFAIENLTLPGQAFKYGSLGDTGTPAGDAITAAIASKPVPEKTTFPFPTTTLTLTWHQVPSIPGPAHRKLLGTVNDAVFDAGVGDYAAETLLLTGLQWRRTSHPNGRFYFDWVMEFLYRDKGHNKIYARAAGFFARILRLAAGVGAVGIYEAKDFSNLFRA